MKIEFWDKNFAYNHGIVVGDSNFFVFDRPRWGATLTARDMLYGKNFRASEILVHNVSKTPGVLPISVDGQRLILTTFGNN